MPPIKLNVKFILFRYLKLAIKSEKEGRACKSFPDGCMVLQFKTPSMPPIGIPR